MQRKAEAEAKVQPRDRAIGGSYGQLATYHQNLAELCRAFLEAITRPGKELPQAFREAINRAYEATVDYLSSDDLRKVIKKLEEVKTALVFGGKGYDVLSTLEILYHLRRSICKVDRSVNKLVVFDYRPSALNKLIVIDNSSR